MRATILVAAVVLWGQRFCRAATDFQVSSDGWNQSDWSLTTNSFIPGQFQSRLSLSNGYTGASLAAAGPFFEIDVNQTDSEGNQPTNGWPLFNPRLSFSTVSGFFDVQPNTGGTNYPWLAQYGWESFISGIPHPTAIIFSVGDKFLDATVSTDAISNFESKLSFKTGVASWSYTWSPAGVSASFNVTYSTFFSRKRPNVVAVKATITSSEDVAITVTDLLDGRSAMRSYKACSGMDEDTPSIYSAVHPMGLANVTAYVVSTVDFTNGSDASLRTLASGPYVPSNDTTIGQSFSVNLTANTVASFFKYVGITSNDKFSQVEDIARISSTDARDIGWDNLIEEHEAVWSILLNSDSVDDFTDPITGELPADENVRILHIASVANAFYLLQSLMPEDSGLNDNSISVGGLVSDSYAGLVFWDADYWMAPGLNLNFPDYSKQISNFRVKQHDQALANAAFNGYPSGSALYSWTAGRYGNCTGTGPCVDYEYHLNFDLAFNMLQELNITQDMTWFQDGPSQVVESIVNAASNLLTYNETTDSYWLLNATDPDEYANNVDNPAFTVASISRLFNTFNALQESQCLPMNNTWKAQSMNVDIPKAASHITLEYQTMNDSVEVKQADVVLLSFPLGYSYPTDQKLQDLDYYSYKQSPNGPAMTYSMFSIISNELSQSGCAAYTYTLNGFSTYLRAPWYQFSEQAVDDFSTNGGTNPAFPFLTGHGGANQVVPFGVLGIRTDQPELWIYPSLPPQITYVKPRTFYYAGSGFNATMNATHTVLSRFSTASVKSVTDKYANDSAPVMVGSPTDPSAAVKFELEIGSSITVPNRRYFETATYPGNLLQCLPVQSPDPFAAGQFPVAAIDGAAATSWQPATNSTASIFINMTTVPFHALNGVYFNWGSRPPMNVTIYLGNETLASVDSSQSDDDQLYGIETKVFVGDINPSEPYSADQTVEVVPVTGNETRIAFATDSGTWSGKYARLEVSGCWEKDGLGALVSEFALLSV